jgi:hypothetical protein
MFKYQYKLLNPPLQQIIISSMEFQHYDIKISLLHINHVLKLQF